LEAAGRVLDGHNDRASKGNGNPEIIAETEKRIALSLRECLLESGEGWLCEEHADDHARLGCDIVWVVDPIDGTLEFIEGLPECGISVGLVVDGIAIAGGFYNFASRELFLGSTHLGVTYNGTSARVSERRSMHGASVLASRQEFLRGDWARFSGREFSVRPLGSVAYKLALVSAGLADATWTLSPKNEWDIAAGVALVAAAGGRVATIDGQPIRFNRQQTLLRGLMACGEGLWPAVNHLLAETPQDAARPGV
jgi:myo-inositol-1(or 4)-monophosphatase